MSAMIQIFIIIPQEKDVRRLKIVSILGVEWLNVKGKVDQQEQYDYQSQQLSPPAPCCEGWRWPRPWSAREGTRFRGSWGWWWWLIATNCWMSWWWSTSTRWSTTTSRGRNQIPWVCPEDQSGDVATVMMLIMMMLLVLTTKLDKSLPGGERRQW